MKMLDRGLLYQLLSVQSVSRNQTAMIAFMLDKLREFGMDANEVEGQIYARKGDHNTFVPYFVAHADTVHSIVPDENYAIHTQMTTAGDIIYRAYDPITGVARGVGGDDKCGLFACLVAAQDLDNVGVLITVDEEIGCQGAHRVHEELLVRPGCMIQLDRRGNTDAVNEISGPISSEAWQAAMSPVLDYWGYKWHWGSITDVGTLSGMLKLSCVNLSAGYHDPHGTGEWISESDLETAIDLAMDMANTAGDTEWTIPDEELRNSRWDDWDEWRGYGYSGYNFTKPATKIKKLSATTRMVKDLLFEDSWAALMPVELMEDALSTFGYQYSHYVWMNTDDAPDGEAIEVYVPVTRPDYWEYANTDAYQWYTQTDHNIAEKQIMKFWVDEIAPHLPALGVDISPLDFTYAERQAHGTHRRNAIAAKNPELCDHDGCDKPWVVYSGSTKVWMCELHYVITSFDTDDEQDMTLSISKDISTVDASPDERRAMARGITEGIRRPRPTLKEKVKQKRKDERSVIDATPATL